ncbi:hypothetical protein HPB49_004347 [Dermacentor silvarum]|uniref:Uncharacterized protein n=1 Tax=Dermacentor silvarum TaxID=543639 RepID=A0ACB8DVC9_DERSI|nr:hypothetical protein HPB49_004347 [Dermacentor silvarum]
MDDTDRSSEASGNSNESGRAHELKLEIEALRIQLEIEKLKSSRVLQDAAQARSESSGIGKYAKELRAVLAPMPTNDTMIPAWFKNADSLLRTLQIPEEMQGALILPFLSDTLDVKLSNLTVATLTSLKLGHRLTRAQHSLFRSCSCVQQPWTDGAQVTCSLTTAVRRMKSCIPSTLLSRLQTVWAISSGAMPCILASSLTRTGCRETYSNAAALYLFAIRLD